MDGEHEIAKLDSLFSFHVAALRNDGRTHEGDLFSSDALAARIKDSGSKVLITADGVGRGEKVINLKSIADTAMDSLGAEDQVETCLVRGREGRSHKLRRRRSAPH